MVVCAAAGCENKDTPSSGVSFHCFPMSDENLLAKWISAVNAMKITKRSRICSDHFTQDSFCELWPGMTRKRLKAGAVPLSDNRVTGHFGQPAVHGSGLLTSSAQIQCAGITKSAMEAANRRRLSSVLTARVNEAVSLVNAESWIPAVKGCKISRIPELPHVHDALVVASVDISPGPAPAMLQSHHVPDATAMASVETPAVSSHASHCTTTSTNNDRSLLQVKLTKSCCDCRVTVIRQNLKIRSLQRQIHLLESKLANVTANMQFLKPDQKKFLQCSSQGKNKGITWSAETVRSALQIRFLTGVHGYQFIRDAGYPLPSYRTLCDRVQHAEFRPGVQHDLLQWLKVKVEGMRGQEKDVVLMLDEMQITKQLEYDKGLNMFLGTVSDDVLVTSEKDDCKVHLACHALVYMIRGLTSNWKQVVSYYLTGVSVSGETMWQLTHSIVMSLADIGINVRVVVSDMGAANRAMWKVAGVAAGRSSLKSCVKHPFFPGQDLYFMADVPHLLKNIRNCLLTQDIILPRDIVNQYGLPSNVVSISHVRKLIDIQENSVFKLAPSLSKKHVNPKQFEKMKVNVAAQLLSHSTASAIRYAVQANHLTAEALTTAWFLETVNSWFDAANARNHKEALYDKSGSKIHALLFMLELVPRLSFVGARSSSWKPIQTGILISTQSLLDVYATLVASGQYRYLLTSRLTQDALENLFSQIRGRGNSHPNPVHFRQCLRLISISQFLAVPKRSSYDSTECSFALNLLKPCKLSDKSNVTSNVHVESVAITDTRESVALNESMTSNTGLTTEASTVLLASAISVDFTCSESNAVCYLTGWIAFKLKKQLHSCDACFNFLVSSNVDDENLPQTQLTVLKSYGWLTMPSLTLQQLVLAAEVIFQQNQAECLRSSSCLQLLLDKSAALLQDTDLSIPPCHNVGLLVLKKFFRLRAHICASNLSKASTDEQQFGSKSAKARTTIK